MTPPPDLSPLERLLVTIDTDRPRWHLDAACRGMTADLFYPARGESTAEATSVCQGCPVQGECLAAAVGRNERFGIWGGTSARQRRPLRREIRRRSDEDGAAA